MNFSENIVEDILKTAADIQCLWPEDRLTQIIRTVQESLKDYNEELDDDDLSAAAGGIKEANADFLRKPPRF